MSASAYTRIKNISNNAKNNMSLNETEYKSVSNELNTYALQIQNNINTIIQNVTDFNNLYNNKYLAECKLTASIKKRIIDKIQRGYIDDK